MMDAGSLATELKGLLGPDAVYTTTGELTRESRDQWALFRLLEARHIELPLPSAVVIPSTTAEVSAVVEWAGRRKVHLLPRGGGSSLTGAGAVLQGGVVIDLRRMRRVLDVDAVSGSVTTEAGISGSALEAALEPHGLTVGHLPVSLPLSTVGGWIATASIGVTSVQDGGLASRLLGLTAVLPTSEIWTSPVSPHPSTQLTRLFVGAEGSAGVVTRATLAVGKKPSGYRWAAFAPRNFLEGAELIRHIVQAGLQPVLRLFNGASARMQFERRDLKTVLVAGINVDRPGIDSEWQLLTGLARQAGSVALGPELAAQWWASRLQDALQTNPDPELLVDTFDTFVLWSQLPRLVDSVLAELRRDAVWAGCRLTHPYPSGAGLQFDFALNLISSEPVVVYREIWQRLGQVAAETGGSISHHLGIGIRNEALLSEQLSDAGLRATQRLQRALDPSGIFSRWNDE